MDRALADFAVEGIPTTIPFHRAVLAHPVFRAGGATTAFLAEHPEVLPPPTERPEAGVPSPATGDAPYEEVVAEVDGRRFVVHLHRRDTVPATRRRPPQVGLRRGGGTSAANGVELASPIQGTMVRWTAAVGQPVRRGETVCVVEAMKMENEVPAHRDGTLAAIKVTPGEPVRVGTVLAEIGTPDA
jgi:acetyl-CoA/propionyl-CoA carboxylase biotin carboxyl carrier protein